MSNLQLNEPRSHFREFYGRNIDQMPNLIKDGRVPLSVAGLMQRRLDTLTASDEVKSAWHDNYFDTGDAVACHPDGRIKVVLDAKQLRELNPNSKLRNGTLVLEDGLYEQLQGKEFTGNHVQEYTGEWLTGKQVKANPVWRALARDQKLLDAYTGMLFEQAKERFDYDSNMAVYASFRRDVPTMRLWFVDSTGGRSNAGGIDDLDVSYGRLVGVAPEARQLHTELKDN